MSETDRKRNAALMLNKPEFDRLDTATVGAIAQAFGASGRIYDKADRKAVWDAIERYRDVHNLRKG